MTTEQIPAEVPIEDVSVPIPARLDVENDSSPPVLLRVGEIHFGAASDKPADMAFRLPSGAPVVSEPVSPSVAEEMYRLSEDLRVEGLYRPPAARPLATLRCWTTRLAYTLLGVVLIWTVYHLLGGPIDVPNPQSGVAGPSAPAGADVGQVEPSLPTEPRPSSLTTGSQTGPPPAAWGPTYRTGRSETPAAAPETSPQTPPETDPTARLQGDLEYF